jgi:ketosteroid isomerase-like protein
MRWSSEPLTAHGLSNNDGQGRGEMPVHDNSTAVGRDIPDWTTFIASLEAAEAEFARGRPVDFKALWSHSDDVTLSGGLGGAIESGWQNVAARLDWASSNYADGIRSRQEFSGSVDADFAYLVQKEIIEAHIGGRTERTKQELRVTMVFRRESSGWRIIHRHADSQTSTWPPR